VPAVLANVCVLKLLDIYYDRFALLDGRWRGAAKRIAGAEGDRPLYLHRLSLDVDKFLALQLDVESATAPRAEAEERLDLGHDVCRSALLFKR